MSIWNLVTNALKQVLSLPDKLIKKLKEGFFVETEENEIKAALQATNEKEKEIKMSEKFELLSLNTKTETGVEIKIHFFVKNGQRWFRQEDITHTTGWKHYPGCDLKKPVIVPMHDLKIFSYNKRLFNKSAYIAERDIYKYIVARQEVSEDRKANGFRGLKRWSSVAAQAISELFALKVQSRPVTEPKGQRKILVERMETDKKARKAYTEANKAKICIRIAKRYTDMHVSSLEEVFSEKEKEKDVRSRSNKR